MDNRWNQGIVESYSFLHLAKKIISPSEFPICEYPLSSESLCPAMEPMREKMIPRFHYITKEEEKDILNGTWDCEKAYENSDMKYGFYFPDVPIGCLERYFSSWFKDICINEMLKPYYTEDDGRIILSKRQLTIAVFSILHEYGHYLDYKKAESKQKFVRWIYKSKEPFREYEKKIITLNEMGTLKKEDYKLRNEIYRKCNDEHSADKYALANLSEKVNEAFEVIWQESNL